MLAVRSWYSQRKYLPDLSSYGNSIQFQRPFLNAQFALGGTTTARPEPFPLLQGESRVDVCIVGGGFMGLSTALTLAEKGVSVAVLEAAEIGWGASGRNNGLVAPGLKRDPWEVRKILGTESGDRLLRYSNDAPDAVFKLIEEHAIDCDLNRGGWIQAAHSKRALPQIEKRVVEWQALGAAVEIIPVDKVSAALGTDFYAGASRYAGGGSINPLAFVYGLAAAASVAGARIYEQSPAADIRRENGKWAVANLRTAVWPLCTACVMHERLQRQSRQTSWNGDSTADGTSRIASSAPRRCSFDLAGRGSCFGHATPADVVPPYGRQSFDHGRRECDSRRPSPWSGETPAQGRTTAVSKHRQYSLGF